jgi:hypothetical protein
MKLARKGLTPSQIGVTLRDSHGIPQVRFVTGNKILRILKSNGACFNDRLLIPNTHAQNCHLPRCRAFLSLHPVLYMPFVWG